MNLYIFVLRYMHGNLYRSASSMNNIWYEFQTVHLDGLGNQLEKSMYVGGSFPAPDVTCSIVECSCFRRVYTTISLTIEMPHTRMTSSES